MYSSSCGFQTHMNIKKLFFAILSKVEGTRAEILFKINKQINNEKTSIKKIFRNMQKVSVSETKI